MRIHVVPNRRPIKNPKKRSWILQMHHIHPLINVFVRKRWYWLKEDERLRWFKISYVNPPLKKNKDKLEELSEESLILSNESNGVIRNVKIQSFTFVFSLSRDRIIPIRSIYNQIKIWSLPRRSRRSNKHNIHLYHLLLHPQLIPKNVT